MRSRVREWIRRYLPAEIIGTIVAVGGGVLAYNLMASGVVAAFAGTWGENLGYYGTTLMREIRQGRQAARGQDSTYGMRVFLKDLRNIAIEFGPAELFDSFLLRPFFMYLLPILVGNMAIGIFAGKITADVTFYIPTIFAYEFKKKYLRA